MEIDPDIENMTLNEYLEYEVEKEWRLCDNVRSKSSPTRYERADFNSSHHDKSISLDFSNYYEDAFIDKYYALPPLLPCFQPSQPPNECGYESPNTNNEVDIDSMTIAEYNLYITRQMKNPLIDHSYSFTSQFFAQPPNKPNTPVDKKDSDFDEILDDLFSIGAKNLRMWQEKIQHGCNVDTSKDTNHESGNLLNFLIFPATNEFSSNCEQDVDLEKEEAEVEDDDDGDTYDIWDITVKDVERIRQFLMPNVVDEMDEVSIAKYVLWKPSRVFTRPLGPPSGLKGLLHTLNATVIPTKLLQDDAHGGVLECQIERSPENETLLTSERLLEGKQKSSGGIFDNIKYLILFSKMQVSSKKCEKWTLNKALQRKDVINGYFYKRIIYKKLSAYDLELL
ncbi:hypothetical protein Tco_0883636 [Tanacetum coccineum]